MDGATLDPVATRLSTSSADGDKDKVGVRLVLQGGHYNGRKQKAVVEVLCDDKLDGTEGEWKSDELGIPPPPSAKTAEDGKDKDDVPHQLKKDGAALIWDSYGPSEEDPKNMDVLKLTWKTKHACEKRNEGGSGGGDKGGSGGSGDGDKDKDKGGQDESKHWGFFTWMIILWVPLSPGLPYFFWPAKSFANFFFFFFTPAYSSASRHTSSLALGSTTTGTARGAGTSSRTATRSATFLILCRIGSAGWCRPCRVVGAEEGTALCEKESSFILFFEKRVIFLGGEGERFFYFVCEES